MRIYIYIIPTTYEYAFGVKCTVRYYIVTIYSDRLNEVKGSGPYESDF